MGAFEWALLDPVDLFIDDTGKTQVAGSKPARPIRIRVSECIAREPGTLSDFRLDAQRTQRVRSFTFVLLWA